MKHKFGFKQTFFVAMLAVAGLFGVKAITINNQTVSNQIITETKADWTGRKIYYANSDDASDIYARVGRKDNNWNSESMTKTSNGYKYNNKFVYETTVWEPDGNLYGLYFKHGGNKDSDTGTLYPDGSAITSKTGYSTFENKLWNGSSWKTIYTVEYNMKNHGTAPSGIYVDSGSKITKPTDPTASGYRFDGWYKESACTNAWNFSTDTVTSNTTLYAKWTQTYAITYYQNEGEGSAVKTEYKGHGEGYTIKAYNHSDIGFHVSALNGFVKYNTAYNGSGQDHYPGESYTTNAALQLFLIQDTATFQYRINDGSWITLENKGNVPSGCQAQFELSNQSFTAGDVVTIRKYRVIDYPEQLSFESQQNLNNGTILYSYTGSIFVKVTTGGAYQVYVEGYSLRGISIERDGHSYKCPATRVSDTEWYVNDIVLFADDQIKAVYQGGEPYEIGVTTPNDFGIDSDGTVHYPGVFKLTLTGYTTASMDWITPTMNDSATATLLAQMFNNDLETVCTSTVAGGATSQITSAFSTHKGYYDHITSTAKTALATGSSDTDVVAMRAKYDFIVIKYGTTIAPDYLGRKPKGVIGGFTPFELVIGDSGDNFATIIIIVASSISLLSITALSVLVIKKRKEKQ